MSQKMTISARKRVQQLPRPRRLAALLGALGLLCIGAHAQTQEERSSTSSLRGKMLDQRQLRTQAAAASSEREDSVFEALAPSGLSRKELRTILASTAPASAPQHSVSFDDLSAGTQFASGSADLLPAAKAQLDALAQQLRGRQQLRLDVLGHTDNQRISARLQARYPTNQALSQARALAVTAYLMRALALPATALSASGKGDTAPLASNATPAGMAQNRRTEIRAWYADSVATPAAPSARTEARQVDACAPADEIQRKAAFSVSIDGVAQERDTTQQEADRQRCVDVALERAAIQIKYDPLNVAPALNVWLAAPHATRQAPVRFGTYTNYAFFQQRAEIRVFAQGQNAREQPLAIVPVQIGAGVDWPVPAQAPTQLGYLLRVYDAAGKFDETRLQPLHLSDQAPVQAARQDSQLLAGWGESNLSLRNISASGGTITISGEHVQPGEYVTALGMAVPVDAQGKFALRQIMRPGAHTVEVAVKDAQGQGMTYRRNLEIADGDWFYVALADLTVGRDRTTGPAQLVTGDDQHYRNETWVDGRGAFYLKGKIKGDYLLTASADTREQPLRDLFHNFQSKDPTYLLRRIDPDKYYPVYGDDSTTVDDAPTQGRFYVRIEKGDSSVMWGNFQTSWSGSELAQYSRGLYGANLRWNGQPSTSYGEKASSVNVFAASPGTLQSREEFRGTGGSQYYLRHLDLTQGSERLWVEVRDKDSGLVIERIALTPSQDYEINYLQGRLSLRSPLSSVADGGALVQSASLSGNPVYLVATYEYVPGLEAISGTAVGVQASHWFNDHLRLGLSNYHQGEQGADQTLKELDLTLRYKPGSWLKLEAARSSGDAVTMLSSMSGGFDFNQTSAGGRPANAKRVEGALDLADLKDGARGRVAAYWQDRAAGYAGPGMLTTNGEAQRQTGISASLPIGTSSELALKADDRQATSQDARAIEAALRHKWNAEWGVSAGLRHERRENANSSTLENASALLSQQGVRTDAVLRLDYRPLQSGQPVVEGVVAQAAVQQVPFEGGITSPLITAGREAGSNGSAAYRPDTPLASGLASARVAGLLYAPWDVYGFVQQTLARSGQRTANDRAGVGGSYQVSDALRLGAEVSGGSGGVGGQLFGNLEFDERSSIYLNYRLENEIADSSYSGRQGKLTTGGRYRLNERAALFAESGWGHGAGPQSLTHAFGVDFAPGAHWSTGVKFETGTLSHPLSGDLKRDAVGLTAAYAYERMKFSTALEFRKDRTSTLGTVAGSCTVLPQDGGCVTGPSSDERKVWLTRNALQYQLDPAWRLLGKLNLSRSTASQGAFYDGDYTEVVAAAAYRPVDNDRWNTLAKYTYFHNLPSAGQVDGLTGSVLDYAQKSHILNFDTTYDLLPWLSVGGKYGMRRGQLRASKTAGDWFSSRADLIVLRADLHIVKEWDGLLEVRRLRAREARDARAGALIGVYRHVAKHAKIGVGYNFTTFSDDLTDLSYRSRGWFLNAISTF